MSEHTETVKTMTAREFITLIIPKLTGGTKLSGTTLIGYLPTGVVLSVKQLNDALRRMGMNGTRIKGRKSDYSK